MLQLAELSDVAVMVIQSFGEGVLACPIGDEKEGAGRIGMQHRLQRPAENAEAR